MMTRPPSSLFAQAFDIIWHDSQLRQGLFQLIEDLIEDIVTQQYLSEWLELMVGEKMPGESLKELNLAPLISFVQAYTARERSSPSPVVQAQEIRQIEEEQYDAATYQQLCIQVRQTCLRNGWVTEENDQRYAWESVVVAWLLRYRPHRVVSPQIEEESIQTALGECDSLLLWGQKRV